MSTVKSLNQSEKLKNAFKTDDEKNRKLVEERSDLTVSVFKAQFGEEAAAAVTISPENLDYASISTEKNLLYTTTNMIGYTRMELIFYKKLPFSWWSRIINRVSTRKALNMLIGENIF